jgi:hypothetical protein
MTFTIMAKRPAIAVASHARAPDELDDTDVAQGGGVERPACDYSIFGTSKRKDFILKVR